MSEPAASEPFTRMDRSSAADWDRAVAEARRTQPRVAEQVLHLLRALSDYTDGSAVDQLTHSLQAATRARRSGADDELVLAALCHDVGRAVSDPNHAAISAAILRPYVRAEVHWMVRVHQDFTSRYFAEHSGGSPHRRRWHRMHPAYGLAERFVDEWDMQSFDPAYDTAPLDDFEPLIREAFATPRYPIRPSRIARRRLRRFVRGFRRS
jgi:predicted HD phosphohydrolase